MKKIMFVLAVTSLLTACVGGGLTRTYPGPERAQSEVAVINCVINISVQSIDGNTEFHGAGKDCQFVLLPGPHRIAMKFYENDYTANLRRIDKKVRTIEFTADKGMKYYLAAFKKQNQWQFAIQEVDPKNKANTSKAKQVDYRVIE